MIAIVDYGMGNIRSVEKGFIKIGADVRITSNAGVISNAKGVVLPGVGAFKDCMRNLDSLRLLDTIKNEIKKGKPYLGICLGLQILFTESEEFGFCRGLDICRGKVVKFSFKTPGKEHGGPSPDENTEKKEVLKIPHMGWNTARLLRKPPVFEDISDNSYFYFVHSFYVVPEDESIVAARTDYGVDFVSVVWKDNIFATQFHPEKSQKSGLKILKGFDEFVRCS